MSSTRSVRLRRGLVLGLLVPVVVIAGLVGVAGLTADIAIKQRYDGNIERFDDPFAAIPETSRPAPPEPEPESGGATATTFLLLGSDSRSSAGDPAQWERGGQRTDAIMLVHVPADHEQVYIVSIPRDTWVAIPGEGEAKVNAAYSFGGPSLLVQTVEQLTAMRIDHVAVVDFDGFVAMTDALGGVEITVPRTTGDNRETFPEGTYVMDGETALNYVRQRYNLPGGDLDRVKRHQNWIRSVLTQAVARDTLTNPARLDSFLLATTGSVALDEGFVANDLRDLAWRLRSVRQDDVTFLTAPIEGFGRSADGQSIVLLDRERADGLWRSLREDDVDTWLEQNQDIDPLGDVVR